MQNLKLFLLGYALFVGPGMMWSTNKNSFRIEGPRIVQRNTKVVLECVFPNNWKYDNQIEWKFSSNTSEQSKQVVGDRWIFSKANTSITVNTVSWEDAGVYECCMKKTNELCAVMHLGVLVLIGSNITFDDNVGIVIGKSEDKFCIDIYLGNFYDVHANVSKVSFMENFTYQLETVQESSRDNDCVRFCVNDADIADINRLRIVVSYKNNSASCGLEVKVPEPVLNMENVTSLWNDTSKFTCNVRGHHSTTIAMTFSLCDERILNGLECNAASSRLNVTRRIDLTTIFASALFKRPRFGVVKCTASNRKGKASVNASRSQINFMKALKLKFVSLVAKTKHGDKVELKCLANAYNFTTEFVFKHNGSIQTANGTRNNYAWEANFTIEANQATQSVECLVEHKTGRDNISFEQDTLSGVSNSQALSIILGGLAVLSVVCLLIYCVQRKLKHDVSTEEESNIPGALEISKSNLMLGRKLGEGEFGVVLMAQVEGIREDEPSTTVAVKIMRNNNNESMAKAMISELKMIILVGQHLNIVNLIGAVTENIKKNELMIVLEYCRYGSVLEFIRKNKHRFMNTLDFEIEPRHEEDPEESTGALRNTFQTIDLICWAKQVADGMDYLASKDVFHGDLAARNVLLCEDNVVKISDFGLARSFNYKNMYKKKSKDRVPYKWLALESMSGQIFGVFSDVWAYGVFLWELFSLGTVPYPGIPMDEHFYNLLRGGYRMEQPRYASRSIYDVMLLCWNENPNLRPTFDKLARVFNAMLPKELQAHYMALGDPSIQANKAREIS